MFGYDNNNKHSWVTISLFISSRGDGIIIEIKPLEKSSEEIKTLYAGKSKFW